MLNDNSGLYARWTILQSQGSSSLQRIGDLRKSYQNPPSIGSDVGYVERIIDLQCFWMDDNGCAGCDGADSDTAISEVESWNDLDLAALGGINAVDQDRDCLMASGKTQPGWPAPVDANDVPSGVFCKTDPNWVIYAENPVDPNPDKSADSDCDGLVDGIEWAYGSNPAAVDSDGDGAKDFVEMFQFTNPIGTGSTDTDGDGFLDKPATGYKANTDTSMDNCPSVANPTQANNDGGRRDNGAFGGDASAPNQDKMGDACDDDDDNDGATDAYELDTTAGKKVSDPLKIDTDADRVVDGAEWHLGTDPTDSASKPPPWSATEQLYYRGCHINVNTAIAGFAGYGVAAGAEMDPDGDGILCPTSTTGDKDSDNGTGTGSAGLIGISDKIESYGFGMSISSPDTDGDGCADWIEIHDLNGDRTVNVGDSLTLSGATKCRKAGLATSDPAAFRVCDITCDGFINVGDDLSLAKNQCGAKPGTGGCPMCALPLEG